MEPIRPNTLSGAAQPNSLTGMGPAPVPGGRRLAIPRPRLNRRPSESARRPPVGPTGQVAGATTAAAQDPRFGMGSAARRASRAASTDVRRSPLELGLAALTWIIALPAALAVVAGLALSISDDGASNVTAYGDALTAAGAWALIGWIAIRALRAIAVSRRVGAIGTSGALVGGSIAVLVIVGALGNFLDQLPLLLQGL